MQGRAFVFVESEGWREMRHDVPKIGDAIADIDARIKEVDVRLRVHGSNCEWRAQLWPRWRSAGNEWRSNDLSGERIRCCGAGEYGSTCGGASGFFYWRPVAGEITALMLLLFGMGEVGAHRPCNRRMANTDFRNRSTQLSKVSGEMPHSKHLRLLEVGVEPCYGAADAVAAMFRLDEHVAFVFVDDELCFDVQRF